jgi:hypothetical protein
MSATGNRSQITIYARLGERADLTPLPRVNSA